LSLFLDGHASAPGRADEAEVNESRAAFPPNRQRRRVARRGGRQEETIVQFTPLWTVSAISQVIGHSLVL